MSRFFNAVSEVLSEAKPKAKERVKLKGYHGSPHKFPPAQRHRNIDTGKMYVTNLENPVHTKIVRNGNFEKVGEPNPLGMFDKSQMGTGEGGQAYGMGHYIAQREETGEYYRDSTTMRDYDFEEYLSDQYSKAERNQDYSRMEMLESAMMHDRPLDFREKANDPDYDDDYRQAADDMANEMESFRNSSDEPVNFGHMYEVEVDALNEEMFDYDANISNQSDFVKKAIYDARDSIDTKIVNDYFGGDRGNIVSDNMTGTDALYNIGKATGSIDGWENALSSRGVKGVQYQDQLSRGEKNNTKNYVVFNDESLNILRRYALPVTLSATAAGSAVAPQESQAGVRKAGDTIFDLSKLNQVPDVPQVPMERYDPPRGMPPALGSLLTPETSARMEGYANVGRDKGGLGWYNLDPLRQSFMEELGDKQGTKNFNSFVDKIAATSPRAKVANNIRRASYLDILDRQGQPFAGLQNSELPKGYGHIAHKTHDASLQDLQAQGSFAALNRPKTSSFAENLKGNQAPMTIDTHNFAALKGDPKDKKSPSNTQYKYLEEFQGEIADKMGMTPAQFQASVWMGGETGVADDRPFMAVFDDVVASTAERDGVTKKKALQNFIQGKSALYDLGPVMLAGGLAANYLTYSENNQPSGVERFADGVLGGADFMANMGSALTAPFVQGVQHFNAMGSPTAEGRTPSLEALQSQKAELGQMLNYSPRTELGQQYTDNFKGVLTEGVQALAPELQRTHQGLYDMGGINLYRPAADGLGALHEWYKSLDPKSRMHVDAGMDVSPY